MMLKRDKLIVVFYLYVLFVFFLIHIIYINKVYNELNLDSIKLISYDSKTNIIDLKIIKNNNAFNSKFSCIVYNDNNKINVKGNNNTCYIKIPANQNYLLYLKNNNLQSKNYLISDYLNNILSFKYKNNTIYLIKDEEHDIEYTDTLIDKKQINYNFQSKDSNIAKVENNKVIGINPGTTTIYSSRTNETLKVIVTDLITKPYATKEKKELLPCNAYTEEEATLLDNILAYKVSEAGVQTRAAAVAAARFLTLEFKYRVAYFYENGRVHSSGVHYVDGEGRYYKTGLYLSDNKKKDILASYRGPAIWGCPLTNLEDEPAYGFYSGVKVPNGLDCSGFVAWVLKNAGYDPGDIGAGETSYPYQMTDLGIYTKITSDLIYSDKVRTGDLINFWGHIAIIIGIDDNNYYVAESLPYLGGVRAMIYPKSQIMNTFEYIVLMDNYYQKDGNYTKMWN
jgi:hypothetical protein